MVLVEGAQLVDSFQHPRALDFRVRHITMRCSSRASFGCSLRSHSTSFERT